MKYILKFLFYCGVLWVLCRSLMFVYGDVPVANNSTFKNVLEKPFNGLLLKVVTTPIFMSDLMVKMNVNFLNDHFDSSDITSVRHKFYNDCWKEALDSLIEEKIFIDKAKEQDFDITKTEALEMLGNWWNDERKQAAKNIGVTEAQVVEVARKEFMRQKLISAYVKNFYEAEVTPAVVERNYAEYIKNNPSQDIKNYFLFTINCLDLSKCENIKSEIKKYLNDNVLPKDVIRLIKRDFNVKVDVSSEFETDFKDISDLHRALLRNVEVKDVGQLIDNGLGCRFVWLKSQNQIKSMSFEEFEPVIRNELWIRCYSKFSGEYRDFVREEAGYTKDIVEQMIQTLSLNEKVRFID